MQALVFACGLLALIISGHAVTAGEILIKPEEAALPPPTASITLTTRALTRKPEVVLTSPEASVSSPFNLQLKFAAHGGSKINPHTFQLIYLRTPNVDLTARVKPYITADGLNMVGAEAPPGQHMIKATISDSDEREGSAVFILNVLK